MSSQTKNRLLPSDPADRSFLGGVATGSLALDLKLGTGGWPRGRIVEVYGTEGTGKTTLLLEAVAHAQQKGGLGAFIDADHGVAPRTAERLGVNLETMPFHRTNSLEDTFEKIDELVRSGAVDVIALDSIAALLPETARTCSRDSIPLRKDPEHQHRVDYFLKALLEPLSRSRAVLLISNHVVEKIGVFYGNPETTPWPTLPLHDYASQRVELRRACTVKDGEDSVGYEVRAKVVKNRLAAPLVTVTFELRFATGICNETELLNLGLETGVLSKRGSRHFFGDDLLAAGRNEAVRQLRQDSALATRLHESILERLQA